MLPNFSKNFIKENRDSFVPESTIATKKLDLDIRWLISLIILSITILLTGFYFVYNIYLEKNIESTISQIDSQSEVLQSDTITSLDVFDKQVRLLKDIESSKGVYTILLNEISKTIIPGVIYNGVHISLDKNRNFVVRISGTSSSLISYIQQSQVVNSLDGLLSTMIFTDYSVSKSDRGQNSVNFGLEAIVLLNNILSSKNNI